MHYRGRAWSEEIDPTFNEIIKKYMEDLRLIQLPANKGHLILSLPEDFLKKIEKAGYPKFGTLYEKDNFEEVFKISAFLFPDTVKNTDLKSFKKAAKKGGISFKDFVKAIGNYATLIKRKDGCDYYLNSFEHLSSEDSFDHHVSLMSEKEGRRYRRKIRSDIISMLWHIMMSHIDELKKENEFTQKLRIDFLNDSKKIRRMLFGLWNNISMMNHKKSLSMLFVEARDGDNDSLIDLFQYDPTLFDHDWVQVRIRKALYSGDMKFFDDLGSTLLKGCLDTRKDNLDITLALVTFWRAGIYRLNSEQKMQLLKDSGIKFNMKENTFRQIVNRIKPFVDWPAIKN